MKIKIGSKVTETFNRKAPFCNYNGIVTGLKKDGSITYLLNDDKKTTVQTSVKFYNVTWKLSEND